MQIRDMIPHVSWPWNEKSEEGGDKKPGENPIAALQHEMNQAFDGFWKRFGSPSGWSPFGDESAPKSDVVETEAAIEVSVELPGMKEEDIEVSLTDTALTIKGEKQIEKKEEKTGYYLSERRYGSFYRSIPLPGGVDSDKVEASFKNGVLTVTLPKTAEAVERTKKIAVKAG